MSRYPGILGEEVLANVVCPKCGCNTMEQSETGLLFCLNCDVCPDCLFPLGEHAPWCSSREVSATSAA